MKEFEIYGKVNFRVSFDVEAESEEQALELARDQILDAFKLNYSGSIQQGKTEADINIDAVEYLTDDDEQQH